MTPKLRLYHISEEQGITCFEPRPIPGHPDRSAVWAIDEQHVQNYLLPRDCPRVTFHCGDETTTEDREKFFNGDVRRHVIAIETGWYDRACSTRLIKYEFPVATFHLEDRVAGYWLSHAAVKPTSEQIIHKPIEALLALGIELRVLPSLWALREAVILSSVHYSIIRMRNAAKPGGAQRDYHPLP